MSTPRLFELARLTVIVSLALGSSTARAAPAASGPAPPDPLSDYRDRFKVGMDRYQAGAVSEAIGYWEPIYRQLGLQAGYRLAYNLGVAYGHLGDATRAAERLQAFLDEVDTRRSQGQGLGAVVAKEEADAHQRMADLTATKGRLRIPASDPAVSVQVDASEPRAGGFVAWVEPGEHTVTFEPQASKSETRIVQAKAGELVEVQPPAPLENPPTQALPSPPASAAPQLAFEPIPSKPTVDVYEGRRPFSPLILAVSGGLDVAAGVAAIVLESRAFSLRDELTSTSSSSGQISLYNRNRFDEERTWAYAAIGGAAGLGAVTASLVSWYFLGSSKHAVLIQPAIGPERGGAIASALAHF
jgi:hypothetical protein